VRRPTLLAVAALAAMLAPSAQAAGDATGRLLVVLDDPPSGVRASAAAARAVVAGAGARRAGYSAPQIGLVTVRPRPGESLAALAARLRRDARVAEVTPERRFRPREVPDDPALTEPETAPGTPPGTVVQWWAERLRLFEAWSLTRGEGALVAVIDQGIDAEHPELVPRIAQTIDLDSDPASGPATTDANGHGTHVASMACATADNGIGFAGVGHSCRLLAIKSDLTDSSIAAGIVRATDAGADSITMSFGQDGRTREQVPASELRAIDYAYDRGVVLVAAASDLGAEEQGDPANVLQPTGSGPVLESGKGLSVTAADFDDRRPSFAGQGTQISMASYGTFRYRPAVPSGPPGIFGALPGNPTAIESGFPPCACRTTFQGDDRYGYLQGTSMAAPMVAAVAALVKDVNPDLGAADVIRILKLTASRPPGSSWNADLGWGILNAGAAVTAATGVDRTAPRSSLRAPRRVRGRRSFVLRWTGEDPAPPGLTATGINRYEVWRRTGRRPAQRIAVTTRLALRLRGTPPRTYAFYTRAIDNAGNREPRPKRPDARTRVVLP